MLQVIHRSTHLPYFIYISFCHISACNLPVHLFSYYANYTLEVFTCVVALDQELYSLANELHLQLMTDHVSEVSQWMVGIKKLIQSGLETSQQ